MNYLVNNNNYMKPQSTSYFLPESPTRNALVNESNKLTKTTTITPENNKINTNGNDKTIQEVWSLQNFQTNKNKMEGNDFVMNSWANDEKSKQKDEKEQHEQEVEMKEEVKLDECNKMDTETSTTINDPKSDNNNTSPSHHARRPMNAFLIFCKKHRPIVRDKFPNLENRAVTRILGEWWALLDIKDRQPFTDLAKEYKDAFLSANPDFKWYKLPAPPLRTLHVRPPAPPQPPPPIHKVVVPLSSPSNNNCIIPEFTPGKLADESQLGGLTSLMNNNFSIKPKITNCCKQLNNSQLESNNNNNGEDVESPSNNFQHDANNDGKSTILPPKPIKKRIFEQYDEDNKHHCENIAETPINNENMTKQELMDKVVDDIFAKQDIDSYDEQNGLLDHNKERKSNRLCKGKRYKEFMSEHKLMGNKRDTKQIQKLGKIEIELNNKLDNQTPLPLDLNDTIKRLAERTNTKIDYDVQQMNDDDVDVIVPKKTANRTRTISEKSDNSPLKSTNSHTSNFNLDLRISNLPNLSYETFMQRKKESKKRKIRAKTECESKNKIQRTDTSDKQLVGSKKRKNKHNITHIGNKFDADKLAENDLLGLATLAEIAANKEKINEKFSV